MNLGLQEVALEMAEKAGVPVITYRQVNGEGIFPYIISLTYLRRPLVLSKLGGYWVNYNQILFFPKEVMSVFLWFTQVIYVKSPSLHMNQM